MGEALKVSLAKAVQSHAKVLSPLTKSKERGTSEGDKRGTNERK